MGRAVLVVAALTLGIQVVPSTPVAEAEHKTRPAAIGRYRPTGADAVYLGRRVGSRRLVWRSPSRHERIITRVRWSKRRDALAFATANRKGWVKLVVVLVGGDLDGHTMTWPVPRRAHKASHPTVTWLGRRRVAFGRTEVRPDVVASWSVRQ
jgi:hypothetical protein